LAGAIARAAWEEMARKHQAWAMMGAKKVIARGMLRNSSLRFLNGDKQNQMNEEIKFLDARSLNHGRP
jgi:hypothetical protein